MADSMTKAGSKYDIIRFQKDSDGNIIYKHFVDKDGNWLRTEPVRDFDEEMRVYWKRRSEEKVSTYWKKSTNLNRKLGEEYTKAITDINKEVASFYAKYADKHGLSMAEARKYLDQYARKDFQVQLDDIIKQYKGDPYNADFIRNVKALRKRKQIERYEALSLNIEDRFRKLGVMEQDEITALLKDSYVGAYGADAVPLMKLLKTSKTFGAMPNNRQITNALQYNWSGQMFSDRLWNKNRAFISGLRGQVTQNLLRGLNPKEGADAMAKFLSGVGVKNVKFNTERIMRTEQMFIVNKASFDAMADAGITHYLYNAHIDDVTSPQCREMNRQLIPVAEAIPGTNFPPLHPFCRSSTSPKFDPARFKDDAEIEVPKPKPKVNISIKKKPQSAPAPVQAPFKPKVTKPNKPAPEGISSLEGYKLGDKEQGYQTWARAQGKFYQDIKPEIDEWERIINADHSKITTPLIRAKKFDEAHSYVQKVNDTIDKLNNFNKYPDRMCKELANSYKRKAKRFLEGDAWEMQKKLGSPLVKKYDEAYRKIVDYSQDKFSEYVNNKTLSKYAMNKYHLTSSRATDSIYQRDRIMTFIKENFTAVTKDVSKLLTDPVNMEALQRGVNFAFSSKQMRYIAGKLPNPEFIAYQGKKAIGGYTGMFTNGIMVNMKAYSNLSHLPPLRGLTNVGMSLKSTITHEYGHFVDGRLHEKGIDIFKDFTTKTELGKKYKASIYGGRTKMAKGIKSDISGYATKNRDELFAETFALITDPAFDPALVPEWVPAFRDYFYAVFDATF